MQIVTPFLQWLELYNGMTMAPRETDTLEPTIAAAPLEENFPAEIPTPQLTLVASR